MHAIGAVLSRAMIVKANIFDCFINVIPCVTFFNIIEVIIHYRRQNLQYPKATMPVIYLDRP